MAALSAAAWAAIAAIVGTGYQAVAANQANQDAKGEMGKLPAPPKLDELTRAATTALAPRRATAPREPRGMSSTILTGPLGLKGKAPAEHKTLLGL